MKKRTGINGISEILGKAGLGCLLTTCCFMLFCGCGAKAPAFIVEGGEAAHRQASEADRAGNQESEADEAGNRETEDGGTGEGDRDVPGEDGKSPEQIYVQVSGAVEKPGVYQLPADSRIFMAVELAGGLTSEADESSLNQAQPLRDGQQIYVCTRQEQADGGPVREEDGRVDLNTATAQELMTLPGIGQSKADSIISYRESHGGFQAVEDLMKIEGIKEGVFSKLKDRVKV